MLKLLRFKIALGFALGTFLLLLLQSISMLALEHRTDVRMIERKMAEDAQRIVQALNSADTLDSSVLNTHDIQTIRLFNANGTVAYIGLIFQGRDQDLHEEPWLLQYGSTTYHVVTYPVLKKGDIEGYLQLGEEIQTFSSIVHQNIFTMVLLSFLFSCCMFFIGLFFEEKAMAPAKRAIQGMQHFAQNAGHELKAPLANMLSSLELAYKTQDFKSGMEDIRVDLQNMIQLIDGLLRLDALEEDQLVEEPVNLSQLAKDIVRTFTEQLEKKHIHIHEDIQPDVVRIADADLVRTALTGLVQNAGKFTPEGGRITVTVTQQYIEITDTGIGMSPDVLGHIFDRLYTADTSRVQQGFGLGLPLVQRIFDMHGWKISVSSIEGAGSTFRIMLPKQ